MSELCPKCSGEMDVGRMPIPHKYLFGYKSERQKHFAFEDNVQKAKACLNCGYLELYIDPEEVKERLKSEER